MISLRIPRYLRYALQPPTLDFETVLWEMIYIVIKPMKAHKAMFYRQQAKHQWARDDPSFIILMSIILALSSIAWGLAYSPSFYGIWRLMLYMIVVDFLAVGIVLSSIVWFVVYKFLTKPEYLGAPIEWAYSFDVHCNAFLVIWFYLYFLQFVFLPLLDRQSMVSLFFGNTLYFIAFSHYCVINFMGYANVPFLKNTEVLLAPIVLWFVIWLASLGGFSIVRYELAQYFE